MSMYLGSVGSCSEFSLKISQKTMKSRNEIKEKINKTPSFNLHLTPMKNMNQELAVNEILKRRQHRRVSVVSISNDLQDFDSNTPTPTSPERVSSNGLKIIIRRSDSFKNTPTRKLSPTKSEPK